MRPLTAITRFGQVISRYPFSDYATQSELEKIYAQYRSFQPDEVIACATSDFEYFRGWVKAAVGELLQDPELPELGMRRVLPAAPAARRDVLGRPPVHPDPDCVLGLADDDLEQVPVVREVRPEGAVEGRRHVFDEMQEPPRRVARGRHQHPVVAAGPVPDPPALRIREIDRGEIVESPPSVHVDGLLRHVAEASDVAAPPRAAQLARAVGGV